MFTYDRARTHTHAHTHARAHTHKPAASIPVGILADDLLVWVQHQKLGGDRSHQADLFLKQE